MSEETHEAFDVKMFRSLARMVCARPKTVLLGAAFLTVCSILVLLPLGDSPYLQGLKLHSDYMSMIPDHVPSAKAFKDSVETFGTADNHLVAVELAKGEDFETGKYIVEKLAEEYRAMPEVIRVDYKKSADVAKLAADIVKERGIFLLAEEDVLKICNRLTKKSINREMRKNRRLLSNPLIPDGVRTRILRDPLNLSSIFLGKVDSNTAENANKSSDVGRDGFFASEDGEMLLLMVRPNFPAQDVEQTKNFIDKCREAEARVLATLDENTRIDYTVSYTGGYAIANVDGSAIHKNLVITISMSFIGVLVLFYLVFWRIDTIFFVGIPLICSVIWMLAVARIVFGSLSIMSFGFAAILIGLGIDFAIHIYNLFVQRCSEGRSVSQALEDAVVGAGGGLLLGAVTTAVAFFTTFLTDFSMLHQFGFLSGFGVLMAFFGMCVLLPAMLVWWCGNRGYSISPKSLAVFNLGGYASYVRRNPGAVLVVAIMILAFGGHLLTSRWFFANPEAEWKFFDGDMRNLRPVNAPAFDVEDRVKAKLDFNFSSFIRVISEGKTETEVMAELARVNEIAQGQLADKDLVRVESLVRWVPPIEQQKSNVALLSDINFDEVEKNTRAALAKYFKKTDKFEVFFDDLKSVSKAIEQPKYLTIEELENGPLKPLLSFLYARAINDDGVEVIRASTNIYPAVLKKKSKVRRAFVAPYYSDATRVTSVSLMRIDMRDNLRYDLWWLASFALGTVTIIMLIAFRSPWIQFLSMVPLMSGIFLTVAVVRFGTGSGLIALHLNYINFLVIPMIIGIGIDDGIHIVHRFFHTSNRDIEVVVRETGRSVVITSLTTMIGFGSLLYCDMPALASLGRLSIVGVGSCLVMSLVLLPALLGLIHESPATRIEEEENNIKESKK